LTFLRELRGETLLRELVERWRNHNLIVRSETNIFRYLNRYYISKRSLPSIQQVSSSSFHDLVFNELKSSVTRTVLGMIDDEREHKLIDRDLLKNVLAIYVEIGSGSLRIYRVDFEQAFLESTKNYYSRKFQSWNLDYSDDHDYKIKVEECLQTERERVANYLHPSTEQKLNEVVFCACACSFYALCVIFDVCNRFVQSSIISINLPCLQVVKSELITKNTA